MRSYVNNVSLSLIYFIPTTNYDIQSEQFIEKICAVIYTGTIYTVHLVKDKYAYIKPLVNCFSRNKNGT